MEHLASNPPSVCWTYPTIPCSGDIIRTLNTYWHGSQIWITKLKNYNLELVADYYIENYWRSTRFAHFLRKWQVSCCHSFECHDWLLGHCNVISKVFWVILAMQNVYVVAKMFLCHCLLVKVKRFYLEVFTLPSFLKMVLKVGSYALFDQKCNKI